ncbi:MAG: hypothetical protein LBL97_07745, partial [Prevotellaceae bacterium]|nr:hypothetical protein [Prevotellaceae bacterium]
APLTIAVGLAVGTALSLVVLRRVLVRRGDRVHAPSAARDTGRTHPYTFRRHIIRLLQAGRRQNLRSFLALALGVLTIFAVGLHRQGFNDSAQLRQGTLGYTLWCESTVPIYHDISTLFRKENHIQALQCLRYSADEASCLNLNKVSTPTVLGVDLDALPLDEETRQAMRHGNDTVYPALVDATVLTWSLGKRLGDTLYYAADDGRRVGIRLAATLPNTIFQGNILIGRADFSRIWRGITGSEVILLRVPESDRDAVKEYMEQSLNEYGMTVTTTSERLRQFNSVTDTYLTIFMTLGGLGLLLGIMTFVIVVRKNLLLRRQEIALYRTLGFTDSRIIDMLCRENRVVPLAAIGTGVAASLLSISFGLTHVGVWLWVTAGVFVLLFVGAALYFVRRSVRRTVYSDEDKPPLSGKTKPLCQVRQSLFVR